MSQCTKSQAQKLLEMKRTLIKLNIELPRWRLMIVIRKQLALRFSLARHARMLRYADRVLAKGLKFKVDKLRSIRNGNAVRIRRGRA
jgi:hypothetical protein